MFVYTLQFLKMVPDYQYQLTASEYLLNCIHTLYKTYVTMLLQSTHNVEEKRKRQQNNSCASSYNAHSILTPWILF